MIDIYYTLISIVPSALAAIGTNIGQGLIGKEILQAIHIQPASSQNISKIGFIGLAVTETATIMSFIMTMLLITHNSAINNSFFTALGTIGIACAVGFSGCCAGIAAAFPAIASCKSLARQPFQQTKLLNMMLVTQTLIMFPNILGFIIGMMIKNKVMVISSFNEALQLLATGLSIGLGCIGPSIGLATFIFAACTALGTNKIAYTKLFTFTFICEAIIETPMILSLIIAFMIFMHRIDPLSNIQGWQFIATALCIGLSSISPGMNTGKISASASKQIALHLQHYSTISNMTILALGLVDSFAVYGAIIAFVILFH